MGISGSLSAIDATSVSVEIKELTEKIDAATLEVKDNTGKVVEVVSQDLVKGETVATFIFKNRLDKAPEGIWTIGGVQYDVDLNNNLAAFATASSQTDIYDTLTALNIKNVMVENLPTYVTEKSTWDVVNPTLADVQKFVTDANLKAAESETDLAAAKSIIEAAQGTNDVVYNNALKSTKLDRVNTDWLADYRSDVANLTAGTDSIKDIQTLIDAENVTQLNSVTAGVKLDKAVLNKEKALLEKYTEPDADGKLPVATVSKIKDYNIQLALADLKTSTSAATFKSNFAKLVNVVDNPTTLSMDDFTAANAAKYADKVAALNTAGTTVETVAKVKSLILTPVDNTQTSTLLAAINTAADTGTDAQLLKALKDAGIKEVTDANKEAYFVAKADIKTASDSSTGSMTAVVNEIKDINEQVTLDAAVDVVNNANSTVTQVRDALTKLALNESGNATATGYINAPAQVKLEVAQFIVDNRELLADLSNPANAGTIVANASPAAGADAYDTSAIAQAAADQAAKVGQFNTGIGNLADPTSTTTKTKTALDNYAYAPYKALSAAQKVAVAEEINKLTKKDSDGNAVSLNFAGDDAVKTMKAANDIIDAAITRVAE